MTSMFNRELNNKKKHIIKKKVTFSLIRKTNSQMEIKLRQLTQIKIKSAACACLEEVHKTLCYIMAAISPTSTFQSHSNISIKSVQLGTPLKHTVKSI